MEAHPMIELNLGVLAADQLRSLELRALAAEERCAVFGPLVAAIRLEKGRRSTPDQRRAVQLDVTSSDDLRRALVYALGFRDDLALSAAERAVWSDVLVALVELRDQRGIEIEGLERLWGAPALSPDAERG
jgi:hypothetical protein